MRRGRWEPVAAAAAVSGGLGLAGALIRLPWHDELYTLELARRPAAAIIEALHLDSGPPGYYLLCRLLHLFGADSVQLLRLLSVLAVMVAVGFVVAAVESARARWVAAALAALHPLVLAAAADARPYAVLMALTAAVVWVLSRPLGRATTVALAVLLGAACWVHSLGLIVVLAVASAAAWATPEERWRAWTAVLVGLALHLPWLPVMAGQPAESLSWMGAGWRAIPAWQRPLLPLLQPSPAAWRTGFVDLASPPLAIAIVASVLWVVVVVAGVAARQKARLPARLWLGFGGTLLAATILLRPVYAPDRAEKIALVFAVLVVGAAAARWRAAAVVCLALAAVGAWSSVATLDSWHAKRARPEGVAAAALRLHVEPGDLVIATSWRLIEVRHGLGKTGGSLDWATFPAEAADHPGWYDDRLALRAGDELPALERRVAAAQAAGRGVWLIRTPSLPSNRMLDGLVAERRLLPVAGQPPYWELWGRPGSAVGRPVDGE